MTVAEGSGARTGARRRARRRRRGIVLGLLTVVGVWAAIVTVHLIRADRLLRAGIAATQQVRGELSAGGIEDANAATDLRAAADDFGSAHADVTSAWLAPLHLIPVLVTQIRSVEALSGAAHTVTDAGTTTLASARSILLSPHGTASRRTTAVRRLATTVAVLDSAVAHVSLGPDRNLLPALAHRRDTFAADLTTLQDSLVKARGATAALADLLTGPRTYLIVAANNAEMRAGAGMMLEAGSLSVRDGHPALGRVVPTSELVVGASRVRASGDIAARWGFEHPTLDFRDLSLSPQFGPNASLAAAMWQERTGEHVDGVISVDIGALAQLLAVTGPVSVGGTTYSSGDVAARLLVGQYVGLVPGQANAARHERLGELAGRVLAAVEGGHTSISALARALDHAVNGRHILVWAADPSIEQDWVAAGAGGVVGPGSLLVSVLNQGADKLDPYQDVTSSLTIRRVGAVTRMHLQVTLHNTTPAALTGYAAGGAPGDPPARQYTGAVAVDLPTSAGYVTVAGGLTEAAGTDYGADTVAVEVAVPQGRSGTVTFDFTLLGRSGYLDVLPSARLPPTQWSWSGPGGAGGRFADDTAHLVRW